MDLTAAPDEPTKRTCVSCWSLQDLWQERGACVCCLWANLFTALCMYSIFSEASLRDNYTLIATSFRSSQPCSWETAIFRQSCSWGTAIFSEFYFWGEKKEKPFLYHSIMAQTYWLWLTCILQSTFPLYIPVAWRKWFSSHYRKQQSELGLIMQGGLVGGKAVLTYYRFH